MNADFWGLLMDKVRAGEMSKDEAYQRNNYFRFAERCVGIKSPAAYVLSVPRDELPPFTLEVYDVESAQDTWEDCARMVEDGQMTPYEGALEYYWAVRG